MCIRIIDDGEMERDNYRHLCCGIVPSPCVKTLKASLYSARVSLSFQLYMNLGASLLAPILHLGVILMRFVSLMRPSSFIQNEHARQIDIFST